MLSQLWAAQKKQLLLSGTVFGQWWCQREAAQSSPRLWQSCQGDWGRNPMDRLPGLRKEWKEEGQGNLSNLQWCLSLLLRFNQCYGVLGVLDFLHGTDRMFRQTKAFERHKVLLGLTPLSESIPEPPKKEEWTSPAAPALPGVEQTERQWFMPNSILIRRQGLVHT